MSVAFLREIVKFLKHYIFLGNTNELRNFSLTTQQRKFLFAAWNIWFAFGAARLVEFRLVSVVDEMA